MASVRSQKMLNSLPQDTIWAKLNWLLTTYPDGIGQKQMLHLNDLAALATWLCGAAYCFLSYSPG